ncbi:MAG TPA: response regulator transcription factor [Nocardioides sp.]|jgi:DNA-binding NarL/FixJ family response regulator|uniref:response regulator transcription factor n=1 Tax=Nocardioides sp. TaxID=35761 RepID=UPI002E2EB3BF|nr:response regulator transcription factor [Nocardioides sp.]HEX3931344.1 response regulator transcription factor [Nocardioides sp.]
MTASIRVLIADDQTLVRTGFRMILSGEPDIDVVGEAANGQEAVDLSLKLHPDVVLMDVRMPGVDGIEATGRIVAHGRGTRTRVLMLTTFDIDEYVYNALQAGASGFLLKDLAARQMVSAVRTVSAGDALLAPSITRRLIAEFAAPPNLSPGLNTLTPRELDVLKLVARGMSNAEIAGQLFVSEATVKTHVARILAKLGIRDRVQAVVVAYESGVVTRRTPSAEPPTGLPG